MKDMNDMKGKCLLGALLILYSLSACTRQNQLQPTTNALTGNWAGDYETQQAGNCTWTGPPVRATATFQVVNNAVTATVNFVVNQIISPTPTQFTGTLNGSTISLSKSNHAVCNGISRTYVHRFDGTINGNTLTMVSRDTVCPVQGCIFQYTLKLTRQ